MMRINTTQWSPAQRQVWEQLSVQEQGSLAAQGATKALDWINQQLQASLMHLRGTVGAGQAIGRGDKIRNPHAHAPVGDAALQAGLQDMLKMAQVSGPGKLAGASPGATTPPAAPFGLQNLLRLFGPTPTTPTTQAPPTTPRLGTIVKGAAADWRRGVGLGTPLLATLGKPLGAATTPLMRKDWQATPSGLQHHRSGRVQAGQGGLEATGQAGYRFGPAVATSGVFRHDLATLGFGGRAALETKGDITGQVTLGKEGLRGHAAADVMLGAEVAGQTQLNTALFDAAAKAKANVGLFAQGTGDLVVDKTGAALDLAGKVGATVGVEGEAAFKTAGVPFGGEELNLNGQVRARAEATAQAEGRISAAAKLAPPRAVVDIGGRAFAGARAEVEGQIGVGEFVTLKGRAGVWAGAGAEGNITFGFDDGKLRFGIKGGAAWGYGAGAGGVVEVDVMKMANAAINTGVEAVGKGITYALNPLEAAKDAAKLVESLPQKAADAVNTVVKTGSSVIKAASKGIAALAKKLFG